MRYSFVRSEMSHHAVQPLISKVAPSHAAFKRAHRSNRVSDASAGSSRRCRCRYSAGNNAAAAVFYRCRCCHACCSPHLSLVLLDRPLHLPQVGQLSGACSVLLEVANVGSVDDDVVSLLSAPLDPLAEPFPLFCSLLVGAHQDTNLRGPESRGREGKARQGKAKARSRKVHSRLEKPSQVKPSQVSSTQCDVKRETRLIKPSQVEAKAGEVNARRDKARVRYRRSGSETGNGVGGWGAGGGVELSHLVQLRHQSIAGDGSRRGKGRSRSGPARGKRRHCQEGEHGNLAGAYI